MYLSNFENFMECVFFTSHEYVVKVAFFKLVLLFALNAWEDE
jgi:hypothetical protein